MHADRFGYTRDTIQFYAVQKFRFSSIFLGSLYFGSVSWLEHFHDKPHCIGRSDLDRFFNVSKRKELVHNLNLTMRTPCLCDWNKKQILSWEEKNMWAKERGTVVFLQQLDNCYTQLYTIPCTVFLHNVLSTTVGIPSTYECLALLSHVVLLP